MTSQPTEQPHNQANKSSIPRPLAIVTGASTGIGYELAKICAENNYDLVIAADEPAINEAAQAFRALGVTVEALALFLCSPQALYAVNKEVDFTPYATTFELGECSVSSKHWSRRKEE